MLVMDVLVLPFFRIAPCSFAHEIFIVLLFSRVAFPFSDISTCTQNLPSFSSFTPPPPLPPTHERTGGGSGDQNSRIFGVLRDSALAVGDTTLDFRTVEAQVLKRGFTSEAFFQCLEEYTELGVLQVDQVGME